MKKCGGNIFEIEFISWKMHSDILKFELESEEKVEQLYKLLANLSIKLNIRII